MLRVGRTIFSYNPWKVTHPSYEGFSPILVLTKNFTGPYWKISPYELKDDKERIMENVWQFSKVYPRVFATTRREKKKIIWQHPTELHLNSKGELKPSYFAWRKKGMENPTAVRWPLPYNKMKTCVYALDEQEDGSLGKDKLDYVQARKEIYLPLYCSLVKQHPLFKELKKRLKKGENLLIIEVDGPHQESLPYYQEKYGVAEDFIEGNTTVASLENLKILLNDPKHPFGHGYCLALALAGTDKKILKKK